MKIKYFFLCHSELNGLVFDIGILWVPVSTCRIHAQQVPDPWIQITHGKISVQIQVLIFDSKIPAGQVQVDPQVNSWHALSQIIYIDYPKEVVPLPLVSEFLLLGWEFFYFVFPLSTMTRIELYLSTSGKSVIKSMEQLANCWVDFAPSRGINAGFIGFLSILNCWHVPHPWT